MYPFSFEGRKRYVQALEATEKLQKNIDTPLVIPNNRLLDIADEKMRLQDASHLADYELREGVKAVMKDSATAILGIGVSCNKNLAKEAAEQATLVPLIESSIRSATGAVYDITGGKDITLLEVIRVCQVVTSLADPSANIIFGAVVDDLSNGEIQMTIIATGFSQSFQNTLLTDTKAAKLLDKMAGNHECKGFLVPLKTSSSPSPVSSRQRGLFF